MGILRLALGEGTTMMKLLISACLVALALADAEPKADADPYYGYYGLGYHGLGYRAYGGYYGHGLGYYGYGHGLTDTTVRCPSNSSQPKTSLEFASRTSEKWIATFGLIPTSATVSVPPC